MTTSAAMGATSRPPNFYLPASMVAYFDDLSAALRQRDVTDDHLAQIAIERYV
jgi:hypothetical protein